MTTPVLVTGATGFVASHLIKQLLQSGHLVRGTVRSLKNTKKVCGVQTLTSTCSIEFYNKNNNVLLLQRDSVRSNFHS